MTKEWYRISEVLQLRPEYSRDRLMEKYNKPGQRYARKMNPARKNSPIEFNLARFLEVEERELEMQARARERRTAIV